MTVTPSERPGMGGTLYDGGVTFRVWAPHADAVYVAGTFNDWDTRAHPLAHEGHGIWSRDIDGVRARKDRYKYVIINGEREFWRIDPYAQDVTDSAGDTIVHDPAFDWGDDNGYHMPPWDEIIIYEMHIGTFNGASDDAPGNLDGVIGRLPHLSELGVNAIQIMPPMEFAGEFSWGYNPAHIFAIESAYGATDGLKSFVKAAHDLGIAVLFDVVYNHFGPEDLDLWQFDGWSENDGGGIYFYNDWRAHTPWGHTRPDYGRGEVRQYIRDNALMWMEEYRVDGLRMDATHYIRNVYGRDNDPAHDLSDGWSLMQWMTNEIRARQSWKLVIAEDMQGNPWITKSTDAGGAGFCSQWDSKFVQTVRRFLYELRDEHRDMDALREVLTHRYNDDAFERVIYTESHDENANGHARVPEEIWPGHVDSWAARKRSTLGAGLVFTAPGIPMLFQGQEFLEDAWFHDEDPIEWSRKERFHGVFTFYRDLIRLRRNGYNHTRGLRGQHINVHHLDQEAKMLAFHRWQEGGPGDDVVVVINGANRAYPEYTVGFPREGRWRVRLNSDWEGYGADYGNHFSYDTDARGPERDGMRYSANVGIGPYTILILSQDP